MKTVTTIRTCDIDGTDGEITELRFGYRGRGYVIDLCPEHMETFRLFLHHGTHAVEKKRGPKSAD